MATAILTWTPGGGGGSQVVQYKKSTESSWTNYSTLSSAATGETIIGLVDNTIYNIRILNNCSSGSGSTVTNTAAAVKCPTVSVNATDSTARIMFPHLSGDVDKYVIVLSDNANAVVESVTLNGPFDSSIFHVFDSLDSNSNYSVKVTPSAKTFTNNSCTSVSFGTLEAPTCGIVTSVAAVMS